MFDKTARRAGVWGWLLNGAAARVRRPPPSQLTSGPALSLSWNAHNGMLAVAVRGDAVLLYDVERQRWVESVALRHAQQQLVRAADWRPVGHDVAVACRGGACVWTLQPGADDYSNASVAFLCCPAGEEPTVVAWSPCGSFLAWAGVRGTGVVSYSVCVFVYLWALYLFQ